MQVPKAVQVQLAPGLVIKAKDLDIAINRTRKCFIVKHLGTQKTFSYKWADAEFPEDAFKRAADERAVLRSCCNKAKSMTSKECNDTLKSQGVVGYTTKKLQEKRDMVAELLWQDTCKDIVDHQGEHDHAQVGPSEKCNANANGTKQPDQSSSGTLTTADATAFQDDVVEAAAGSGHPPATSSGVSGSSPSKVGKMLSLPGVDLPSGGQLEDVTQNMFKSKALAVAEEFTSWCKPSVMLPKIAIVKFLEPVSVQRENSDLSKMYGILLGKKIDRGTKYRGCWLVTSLFANDLAVEVDMNDREMRAWKDTNSPMKVIGRPGLTKPTFQMAHLTTIIINDRVIYTWNWELGRLPMFETVQNWDSNKICFALQFLLNCGNVSTIFSTLWFLSHSCSRLVFERPLQQDDERWVFQQNESNGNISFVGIVHKNDLSCEFFNVDDSTLTLVPTTTISVETKGNYASLQRGFWFVQDRLRQTNFEHDMAVVLTKTSEKCSQQVRKLVEKDELPQDAVEHVASFDHLGAAIALLDKKADSPDGPLAHDDYETLRSAASSVGAVNLVLVNLAGWKSNEAREDSEAWRNASRRLKAFRSVSQYGQMQEYALRALPVMHQTQHAADFMGLLSDYSKSSDVAVLLEDAGYAILPENPTVPDLLSFTGHVPYM